MWLAQSYLACISMSLMPWKAPQNEHRFHHHVFATAGTRVPLPLCVRRIHQSENIPVYLLFPVGLLCADHRGRHSIVLPRLQPPRNNLGVAECGPARTLGCSSTIMLNSAIEM